MKPNACKNPQPDIFIQVVGLFIFTNGLWSGHKEVSLWIHQIMGKPAAFVAGYLLRIVPYYEGGNWVLPMPDLLVRVTRECDAFGFFSLIVGVSSVYMWRKYQGGAFMWRATGIMLAAYCLTIGLNGLRIAGGYYMHLLVEMGQWQKYQALCHLGVGVTIFLPALFAVVYFWEKGERYE